MAATCAYAGDDANGKQSKSAAKPTEPAQTLVAKNQANDYIIGSEDVLSVNVWKEPEISKVLPVRPDGKISLPLIGDTAASGLTPKQLQENIEKNLEAYMSHPEVTVIVQEAKSQRFNIVGEVERPGSYTLGTPMCCAAMRAARRFACPLITRKSSRDGIQNRTSNCKRTTP